MNQEKPELEGGWHPNWEDNVYSQGRHLNRYPYNSVVSFIYSHFGHVANRSKVNILELGCGAGNNIWFAAREGFTVAGIDGSSSAIEYAKTRFAQDGLHGDLRVGDFSSLSWSDEKFDFVLDRGALTNCRREGIENALMESARVSKTGGRFFSETCYSWEHPGRLYGHDLGDNSFDNFTGGYFQGLGTIHFTTREEIEMLYANYLQITSMVHIREEDQLNTPAKVVDAYWQISAIK